MAQRIEALPGVPPLSEVGAEGFRLRLHGSCWSRRAKRRRISLAKLAAELRAIGSDARNARRIRPARPRSGQLRRSPDELKRFVEGEIVRWGTVVREAGLLGSE